MAKLAENLVEEWLNRQGFFTIRGLKQGVNEMDILAVRSEFQNVAIGWHVEVQAGFRPVGYISPPANAKKRTPEFLAECVKIWVERKFLADGKYALRKKLWPSADWSFHLVHAVVREPLELELIHGFGITLHTFKEVLNNLCADGKKDFTAESGGDLAEIVDYYEKTKRTIQPAT
jgi:hypothetical protein